jgi:hypothetical protein
MNQKTHNESENAKDAPPPEALGPSKARNVDLSLGCCPESIECAKRLFQCHCPVAERATLRGLGAKIEMMHLSHYDLPAELA